jgi:hypothetical protein
MSADAAGSVPASRREPRWFPPWLLDAWNRFAPLPVFYVLAVPAASLRAPADDYGLPVHTHFNWFERLVLTAEPNRWLQSLALDFRAIQYLAVGIYLSWFGLKLYAVAPLMLRRRPYQAWQLVGYLLLLYYGTMALFWLYPVQPPWMHFGDIARVQDLVFQRVSGSDNNPHAAMPSLHVMMPFAVALWYGLRDPIGKVFAAYSALIAVTVVYTGDHYVADLVAGYLLVFAYVAGVQRLPFRLLPERPAEAVERFPLDTSAVVARRAA